MMDLLLLAEGGMGALVSSSEFKGWMTLILVVLAVIAFGAPALFSKIKAGFTNFVEELKQKVTGETVPDGKGVADATAVSELVKQRATALRSACPKAPAELRLKWLDNGMDENQAKTDYITVLESMVPQPATPPATPPAAA